MCGSPSKEGSKSRKCRNGEGDVSSLKDAAITSRRPSSYLYETSVSRKYISSNMMMNRCIFYDVVLTRISALNTYQSERAVPSSTCLSWYRGIHGSHASHATMLTFADALGVIMRTASSIFQIQKF